MSKTHPPSYLKFLLVFLALQIFTEARGQQIYTDIAIDDEGSVHIEGRFADDFRPTHDHIIGFRTSVIGDTALSKRISALQLFSEDGSVLQVLPTREGEFAAPARYSKWRYTVDLRSRSNRSAAHASWLSADGGVLMIDDLLPLIGGDRRKLTAAISLKLPAGWSSFSSDTKKGGDRYDVQNIEGGVIFVGDRLSEIAVKSRQGRLSLVISGEWIFTDAEASQMAGDIFDAYTKLLGPPATTDSLVAVLKFPEPQSTGVWEAETRGSTVTIISSDTHFRTQSQQRLHEQLRHEIFHLWFPNGVNLTGDYAWFYEGFALYESLKLGVALKRIRFEDYLDTLSRAYTIDVNSKPVGPFVNSRNIDTTQLYSRGMIVAFLSDLSSLQQSGGKIDSTAKLRSLFTRHKLPATGTVAAGAVRDVVGDESIKRYILASEAIEWSGELEPAGLEAFRTGRSFELKVTAKPNARQKAILRRLGYN